MPSINQILELQSHRPPSCVKTVLVPDQRNQQTGTDSTCVARVQHLQVALSSHIRSSSGKKISSPSSILGLNSANTFSLDRQINANVTWEWDSCSQNKTKNITQMVTAKKAK
jgi:hypothetical protein